MHQARFEPAITVFERLKIIVIGNKKITGHHRKKGLRVQVGITSLFVIWEEL